MSDKNKNKSSVKKGDTPKKSDADEIGMFSFNSLNVQINIVI